MEGGLPSGRNRVGVGLPLLQEPRHRLPVPRRHRAVKRRPPFVVGPARSLCGGLGPKGGQEEGQEAGVAGGGRGVEEGASVLVGAPEGVGELGGGERLEVSEVALVSRKEGEGEGEGGGSVSVSRGLAATGGGERTEGGREGERRSSDRGAARGARGAPWSPCLRSSRWPFPGGRDQGRRSGGGGS